MLCSVSSIPSSIDCDSLSSLIASKRTLTFYDSGCVLDIQGPTADIFGTDPFDNIDLIASKEQSAKDKALVILAWATYWAEERCRNMCSTR